MDEKTVKILFVLGMTFSFPVVLAVMVSLRRKDPFSFQM